MTPTCDGLSVLQFDFSGVHGVLILSMVSTCNKLSVLPAKGSKMLFQAAYKGYDSNLGIIIDFETSLHGSLSSSVLRTVRNIALHLPRCRGCNRLGKLALCNCTAGFLHALKLTHHVSRFGTITPLRTCSIVAVDLFNTTHAGGYGPSVVHVPDPPAGRTRQVVDCIMATS